MKNKNFKKLTYIGMLSAMLLMGCDEKRKPYYMEKNIPRYYGYDVAIENEYLIIGNLKNDKEEPLEYDDHIMVIFDKDSTITDMQVRAKTLELKIELERFIDAQKLKTIYSEMNNKRLKFQNK